MFVFGLTQIYFQPIQNIDLEEIPVCEGLGDKAYSTEVRENT